MLNILKFLLFLGLGVALIWLALRKTTDEEFTNIKISLANANYFWIFLSIILSGLSHLFRALRWKILLNPLGYNPKTSNTFFSVMVGYLANFALPRLGEISRCGLINVVNAGCRGQVGPVQQLVLEKLGGVHFHHFQVGNPRHRLRRSVEVHQKRVRQRMRRICTDE